MIAIISSRPEERLAFAAVCEGRKWVCVTCDSIRAFRRALRHSPPSLVLTRHKLSDGYSDDIFAILGQKGMLGTRTIVLLEATTMASEEARQVSLGADLVNRDPLRTDVLIEYLARFRTTSATLLKQPRADQAAISFANTKVLPLDRVVKYRGASVKLTRREMELLDILAASPDSIVTYQTLYHDILDRRFAGETSNMRVLLGKLLNSFVKIGCQLRPWIDVIPKTGYRYRSSRRPSSCRATAES